MRRLHTDMPDGVERSSGSRVRLPVSTTRLMLVAAMVAGSFRATRTCLTLLGFESTGGFGRTHGVRRFLRTKVAKSARIAREASQSRFATLIRPTRRMAPGLARPGRASGETAAREVFQPWRSSAAGRRAGEIARPEGAADVA